MLAAVIHLPPIYTVQGLLLRDGNAHNGLGLPESINGQDSPLQEHPQGNPVKKVPHSEFLPKEGGCCAALPGSEAGFQLKTTMIQDLCPLRTCTHMHSHN